MLSAYATNAWPGTVKSNEMTAIPIDHLAETKQLEGALVTINARLRPSPSAVRATGRI